MKEIKYSAPSVKKAFSILEAIGESSSGLGVSELGKKLKIGKSTVHGITLALEELGVLTRDRAHKKFTIGYTLMDLGRKAYRKIELVTDVAQSPMEALMGEVGETVFLGIMHGDHAIILKAVESHNELKITAPIGSRVPLLAGALGRVFLAQMEEEKAIEVVQKKGLRVYTANSVTDPKQFLEEVAEARRKGFAIDREKYILGVTAVASPIETISLPPVAIWVVGFSPSFSEKKMEKVIQEIQKAAMEISRLIKNHHP
ncbi:MAG: IclR family transcriptional regulator [Desulfobacca sp.]|nr:IclR family transcriptional regulator [Desulfobacca sp.]